MIKNLEGVLKDRHKTNTTWQLEKLPGDKKYEQRLEDKGNFNQDDIKEFEDYLIESFSPDKDAEIIHHGNAEGRRTCKALEIVSNKPCGVWVKYTDSKVSHGHQAPKKEIEKNGDIADRFAQHGQLGQFATIYRSPIYLVLYRGFATMAEAIPSLSAKVVEELYSDYYVNYFNSTTEMREGMAEYGIDSEIWYCIKYASMLPESYRDEIMKYFIGLHRKITSQLGKQTPTCLNNNDGRMENKILVNGGTQLATFPDNLNNIGLKAIDSGHCKDFCQGEFKDHKILIDGAEDIYYRAKEASEKGFWIYTIGNWLTAYFEKSMRKLGNRGGDQQRAIHEINSFFNLVGILRGKGDATFNSPWSRELSRLTSVGGEAKWLLLDSLDKKDGLRSSPLALRDILRKVNQ